MQMFFSPPLSVGVRRPGCEFCLLHLLTAGSEAPGFPSEKKNNDGLMMAVMVR